MHARRVMLSAEDRNLPYRVRDVAMDVGLLMIAATFTLLGGAGLVAHLLGVAYPLSGLMVADAALTGFLAGLCLLGWLYQAHWLRYLAALPLAVITLYTMAHNAWAGDPWQASSWVTGGPRIISAAAILLFLVALCSLLGMGCRRRPLVWVASGLIALLAGGLSLAMLLLPASRIGWASGFVSAPMLATLYALLGGIALVGAAWRGPRRMLPVGTLPQVAAVAGVMTSCLAWYVLTWNAQSAIHQQASILLDNVELNTRRVMNAQMELIQRLAWRHGEERSLQPSELWDHDVDAYFQHAPYLDALTLIGPEGQVDDLRTPHRHERQGVLRSLSMPEVKEWLAIAWQAPRSMQAPLSPTKLLLSAPVGNQNRQLVAYLDLPQLLMRELGVQLNLVRLAISTAHPLMELRQPGRMESAFQRPMPHLGTRHTGLPGGGRLTFDVFMDSPQEMLRAGLMPGGFAISGLVLSYLLALSLALVRLVLGRSHELLAARRRLEAQYDLEQRFRSLYLYHPDGVFSLNSEGHLVSANDACNEITGRKNEEVLGSHFSVLLRPQESERMLVLFATTLAGEPGRIELTLEHSDGHLKSIDLTTLPIIVEGVTQGVFGIAKDITRQREHEAQIAYQASHDLLTGLPNRNLFDERLEAAFLGVRENDTPLLVMYLDLDGFKAVNDGLGHAIGNQLLVAVADRLRELVQSGDTIARLTGDEYGLLLPRLGRQEEATALAERILASLNQPYYLEGAAVHISASIGIASSDGDQGHAQELLQQADIAVSIAKRQGRNTWQWYRGDGQQVTAEEVLLRHDLYTAMQDGEFALHYQPIVEADSCRVRGYEALIRWHHPQRGMISPGVFIPLAEQTGQIIPLGQWVLRRACRDAVAMLAKAPESATVAVNISSLQFRRPGFLEEVEQALANSGLAPEQLELEVTESILLEGVEHASELIHRLGTLGVRVALDDFGTGFSSLSYLRDLPIHKVKLDRAFIHDIESNPRNAAIVQGVITMAHHMAMVVVAEGIETDTQHAEMCHRGCDLLQGFLFAMPMPREAIMALPGQLPA